MMAASAKPRATSRAPQPASSPPSAMGPAAAAATPLFKALASSSTTRRRQAMASIRTYLASDRTFTQAEYLKIWKALFYCLYMTPKMRLQQRLAVEMSELVGVVADATRDSEIDAEEGTGEQSRQVVRFVGAFWETMRREWSGIDKARLDKFLFLVRRVLFASLVACREATTRDEADAPEEEGGEEADEHSWDLQLLRDMVECMQRQGGPLVARNVQVPDGLRLHVLDVVVDEAERAGLGSGELEVVLEAVRTLQKETLTKTVRMRAKEVLADERIAAWGGRGDGATVEGEVDEADGVARVAAEGGEDEEWAGIDE